MVEDKVEDKFVYKDYLPASARVVVEYGKEQQVSFSYPRAWTYKKAVWCRGYFTIMCFWFAVHLFGIAYCLLIALPFLIGYGIFQVLTNPIQTEPISLSALLTFIRLNYVTLLYLSYSFGVPAILTWRLSKKPETFSKWVPKMGYWASYILSGLKEVIFNPSDVVDNKCVIPIFSNVFLEYKATEDFEKHLTKVEILELPFSSKYPKHPFPLSLITQSKDKKVRNEWKFRAVFYFSQTPKTGELMVEFI